MYKFIAVALVLILTAVSCGKGEAPAPDTTSQASEAAGTNRCKNMQSQWGLEWDAVNARDFLSRSYGGVQEWGDPVQPREGVNGFMSFDFTIPGMNESQMAAVFFRCHDEPVEFIPENYHRFLYDSMVLIFDLENFNSVKKMIEDRFGQAGERHDVDGMDLYVWKCEEEGRVVTLKKTAITVKLWFLPLTEENRNDPQKLSPAFQ